MTKDEALKLALDWLEEGNFVYPTSLRTAIKEALAQPEQVTSGWSLRYVYFDEDGIPLMYREPEERNFCQRCGKRTADLTTIHTCTPPLQPTIREW
jgi:hypothetical protein